jgi:hypothetical protein
MTLEVQCRRDVTSVQTSSKTIAQHFHVRRFPIFNLTYSSTGYEYHNNCMYTHSHISNNLDFKIWYTLNNK